MRSFPIPARYAALAIPAVLAVASLAPTASAQEDVAPLSIAFASDVSTFDPAIGYDALSFPIEHALYDTLVTYDEGTTLVPGLAAAMPTVSDDGLTYTFDIRTDVPFVRQGEVVRNVTVDDVVFSLNRLFRPDLLPTPSPIGPSFYSVIEGADDVLAGTAESASGIRAIDDDTVEITLEHPDRTFLNALAMPFGSILPEELAGMDAGAFSQDPVGTGPFYLESYVPAERIVLRRNPHYWREGFPKADAIEMRLGIDPSAQLLQVQGGALDMMGSNIATADWNAVTTDPAFADRVISSELIATNWMAMDTSGPDSPFTDPLVRRAVSHAIDKANLVRLQNGRGVVAGCIFPTQLPGHDAACDPYPYDEAAARALMAEAGNTGFSTQLYTDTSAAGPPAGASIAADLAEIGIDVEVVSLDFGALMGTITTPHGAPMSLIGWGQDFPDPSDFVDPMFTCATAVEGSVNVAWYCDRAVDEAAAAARQVTDLDEAIPLYQDIQGTIMEAAPVVPLQFPTQDGLISERVTGFEEYHPVWLWDFATIGIE
ncbi:MAG: ABC transporter substrate-binding protein [Candidatus Limnocylindrales bacterium]